MEYVVLSNVLPVLESNPVTLGLFALTVTELIHQVAIEKDLKESATSVVCAGLLGIATLALPQLGIQTSPEIVAYISAIGFNLPRIMQVITGEKRIWSTSLPMGVVGAGIGVAMDMTGLSGMINVNQMMHQAGSTVTWIANQFQKP